MTQAKPSAPSQSADKYIVRFPAGMRDRLAAAAKLANRSMNAEIIARLEQSFKASAVSSDIRDYIVEEVAAALRREVEREAAGQLVGKKAGRK